MSSTFTANELLWEIDIQWQCYLTLVLSFHLSAVYRPNAVEVAFFQYNGNYSDCYRQDKKIRVCDVRIMFRKQND